MDGERLMWLAVAKQAVDDINEQPVDSLHYADARAFLTERHGTWAQARQGLADLADVGADDLLALGEAAVKRRSKGMAPPPALPIAPIAPIAPAVLPVFMVIDRDKRRAARKAFMPWREVKPF